MDDWPWWRHTQRLPGVHCAGHFLEALDRSVHTGWDHALHGGGAVDIRKADTLHRVQVVEIAPELLEAMGGGQRCRFVAEVVLAEFAGIVAQVEQELGEYRGARQQRTGSTRQLGHNHTRPQGVHTGKEGGAAGRAALFCVIGHKPRAFLGDAVDVGGLAHHQALVVGADIHDADVIAHNEQNVGFISCGLCHCGQSRGKRKPRKQSFQAVFHVKLLPNRVVFFDAPTDVGAFPTRCRLRLEGLIAYRGLKLSGIYR